MIKHLTLILALSFSNNLFATTEEQHFSAALDVVMMPENEQLEAMVKGLVDQQVMYNSSYKPIRSAFETFYREIFQSEEFLHGLARIQMDLFTYEELLEMKKMMDLPIFRKYQQIMPAFLEMNMQLGQEIVFSNQERLKALIDKEHRKIEKLQELDEHMNLTGEAQ